jgi:hypothetical protein
MVRGHRSQHRCRIVIGPQRIDPVDSKERRNILFTMPKAARKANWQLDQFKRAESHIIDIQLNSRLIAVSGTLKYQANRWPLPLIATLLQKILT